jgi:hypothetical protein
MPIVAAALLLVAALAATTALVGRVRRRPLGLAAPLGLAVLVAWEALALRGLSRFSAVTPAWVAAAQLVPVVAWLALVRGDALAAARRGVRRARSSVAALGVAGIATLPLLALTAVSAWRYAPQNWDSMTYHLARVAHWIQNASVAEYRTHIPRQNVLGPGAEYLLLVVQVIARSDALANALQTLCYALVIFGAPAVGRLAGVPRAIAPWLAPAVASVPMAILQASTTQNDLVAAALTIALVAAATPFLHRGRPRWRSADLVLLGAVGAAALLVKITSLLTALPVLAAGAVLAIRALPFGGLLGRRLAALGAATALTAVVAAPDAIRLLAASSGMGAYVYAGLGDWGDRATNLLRGAAHHLPVSSATARLLGISEGDSVVWPGVVFHLQEDVAGNPVHLALVTALLVVAIIRWRGLRRRARAFVCAGAGAWVVVHFVLRDNMWFSRLQTPLFVVVPVFLAAALPWRSGRPPTPKERAAKLRAASPAGPLRWGAPAAAAVLLSYGYFAALRNSTRPPLETPPWVASRDASYYVLRPDVAPEHGRALEIAEQIRCSRIGLYVGGDSFDYPLTWRAMTRGIEVRHVFFDHDAEWPCIIVSDRGLPPTGGGGGWGQASRQVFVSAAAISER